jgi:hypothetical protein
MEIKSLTHLKKILKVGMTVKTTYHLKSNGSSQVDFRNIYADEERPPRQVIECNTTGFTLATLVDGEWEGRRLEYPKASVCCIENGNLIIMGNDLDNPDNKSPIKWLTIQIED